MLERYQTLLASALGRAATGPKAGHAQGGARSNVRTRSRLAHTCTQALPCTMFKLHVILLQRLAAQGGRTYPPDASCQLKDRTPEPVGAGRDAGARLP